MDGLFNNWNLMGQQNMGNGLQGLDLSKLISGNTISSGASKAGGLFDIEGLTGLGALNLGGQLLGSLGGIYGGMQQYKLGRDSLNFQKDAFNRNMENQRKLVNSQLSDRQAARVNANPGNARSVDDYMKEYGV